MTDYDSNFFDKNNHLFKDRGTMEKLSTRDSRLDKRDSYSSLLKFQVKHNILKNVKRQGRSEISKEILENTFEKTTPIPKKEYEQILEEFLDGERKKIQNFLLVLLEKSDEEGINKKTLILLAFFRTFHFAMKKNMTAWKEIITKQVIII